MAASSLRAAALRGAPLATLPLAAAWAPVSQLVDPLTRGAACFSTTGAHASAAAGGGGGGTSGPDTFTAALQQKTEEELRELALKQAQPHAADGPEDGPEPGPDEEQLPVSGGRVPVSAGVCCVLHGRRRQSAVPVWR